MSDEPKPNQEQQPAPKPEPEVQPGAGKPFVEGPPMSVGDPLPAGQVNRVAAIAGLVLAVLGVMAVVIVGVALLGVCLAR